MYIVVICVINKLLKQYTFKILYVTNQIFDVQFVMEKYI